MGSMVIKLIIYGIAILLGLWNFLWREAINLPFLSDLSSLVVWIIVGVIVAIGIIVNWFF